jgi:hypothetical protein
MRRLAVPLLTLLLLAGTRQTPSPPAAGTQKIDFEQQVKPILQAKCQPCHFAGGKMYAKLPFDRPETILTLREKLFTRIKDEPSRAVIRKFLAAR